MALKYILKRIVMMLPTLFGITLVTFLIINLAPGGPIEQKIQAIRFARGKGSLGAAQSGQQMVSPEIMEALRKQYGFDKPLFERYWIWIKNASRFEFGNSFVYGQPAMDVILARAPVSLQFGAVSFIITYGVSITLGLIMARRVGRGTDTVLSFALIILASIPAFMLGVLLLVYLSGDTFLNIFPTGYLHSDNYDELSSLAKFWDRVHHFILPLTCYVIGGFTALTLLGRNSVLEESKKDYARTARAKGLSEQMIYAKHILRNALIPLVTGIGGALAMFLSGSLLVESVFQLQGIGLLGFQSVMARDYNLIMALLYLSSLLMLAGNLFGDLLYVMVDPRVRFD
jgi:microcin C transport system permease protein